MKAFLIGLSLLATAMGAPTSTKSIVTLRLLTSMNPHYTPGTQQIPTRQSAISLPIPIGANLSFDHAPFYIQAIEIEAISAGEDFLSQAIAQDDQNIVCEALTDFSSKGVKFSIGDVRVLNEGRQAVVTGLRCGHGEAML